MFVQILLPIDLNTRSYGFPKDPGVILTRQQRLVTTPSGQSRSELHVHRSGRRMGDRHRRR